MQLWKKFYLEMTSFRPYIVLNKENGYVLLFIIVNLGFSIKKKKKPENQPIITQSIFNFRNLYGL